MSNFHDILESYCPHFTKIGVLGVPEVQTSKKPIQINDLRIHQTGTLGPQGGVLGVPEDTKSTPGTPEITPGVLDRPLSKPRESALGEEVRTPRTPGTRDFGDYYQFYEERAAIRQFEGGLSKEDAEGQARNDTVLQFLEDTGYDQDDVAVNRFIKALYNLQLTLHNHQEK